LNLPSIQTLAHIKQMQATAKWCAHFNPLVLKDNFSCHAAWCWQNETPPKVISKDTCKVMGSHLNAGSLTASHLILTPKD